MIDKLGLNKEDLNIVTDAIDTQVEVYNQNLFSGFQTIQTI